MPKLAVAIRHVHFEDLGSFAEPIEAAGYQIKYCDVGLDALSTVDPIKTDLLIVLGGPISAYGDDRYPFLKDEIAFIKMRLGAERPTVGICLGAQLMALALGAHVYPTGTKEIGWTPIELTPAGKSSPLRHFERSPVLHWHGDTFDLPDGATLLASTELCRNQAFAIGQNTVGFQFHPEADGRGFERWLIGHAVELASVSGLSLENLRAGAKSYGPAAGTRGQSCFVEWLERTVTPTTRETVTMRTVEYSD